MPPSQIQPLQQVSECHAVLVVHLSYTVSDGVNRGLKVSQLKHRLSLQLCYFMTKPKLVRL